MHAIVQNAFVRTLAVALLMAAARSTAFARPTPLGSAFTYQGVLKSGGNAYNGTADLVFTLYDAASGGSAIGGTLSIPGLAISNGLISASLNFGSLAFDGNDRWLEIAVHTPSNGGAGPFTTLSPRQKLAAAPYAMWALNSLIAGPQPNQVSLSNASNAFAGAWLAIDGSTLNVDSTTHRVGIGTATPNAPLQVAAGGTAAPIARVYNGSDLPSSISLDTNYRQWRIGQNQPPDSGELDEFFIYDATANFGAGATRLSIDTSGNVGIGTNFPAAKLDVNGTVNAGALSIPATTRRLAVSIAAFTPSNSGTTYGRGAFLWATGPQGTVWGFQAPVCLPDGATITRLDVQALDNASGFFEDLYVYIGYVQDGDPTNLHFIANVQTSFLSATVQALSDTTISDPVVDNLHRSYAVYADFTVPANPLNLYLSRVVITYTVTSPLP